ncbi:MAG: hypothetical protein IJZ03_05170 [Clostridia bacterium]|nr:hypothetical protein [Clostridia bacterium]MBQ9749041.1 hypothetical protein [Clostridia bacterium]
MYKVTVPISMNSVNLENMHIYLELAKKCKVDRVLICGMGDIYSENSNINTRTSEVKAVLDLFKSNGFETGVWISAFGHGIILSGEHETGKVSKYTVIEGVNGGVSQHGFCPLDENFASDYAEAVKKIAVLSPDIILLDDDFRINTRYGYYMGCFCPLHLAKFYSEVGEEIPRDKIEKFMLVGGKNKYRDAYMKIMKDTLLSFAKRLRAAVDEVNEDIRLASCSTFENWDFNGTDMIEIARAFAGKTKPFTRVAGAPYWDNDISMVIETTRSEFYWCKDTELEICAEGDTYPRPRYNVPSRTLELFEYAIIASGLGNGILNYIFDYHQKPDYETGYIDRYVRNAPTRKLISELFEGKSATGVRTVNVMHKLENWDLPDVGIGWIADALRDAVIPSSVALLSRNSISTSLDAGEYPAMITGENAKYTDKDDLKNGAILDVTAARIFMERGIDTGLLNAEKGDFISEYYSRHGDSVPDINNNSLYRITCNNKAEVLSIFRPTDTPASYIYENTEGLKFYVVAYDAFFARKNANFSNNYYRQDDIMYAVKRLCGKDLPAVCKKNPGLYVYTAADEDSMSVLLMNIHLDDVIEPFVQLDRSYSDIRFINCSGRLDGDKVYLSDIGSYSMAAFEVK